MAKTKKIMSVTLLFVIIVFGLIIQSESYLPKSSGEEEGTSRPSEPVPVERAIGIPGLNSRCDAFLTWFKLAWLNLRQPKSWYGSGKSEKKKEAATKSFEMGKETLEVVADVTADVAKKTVERTVPKKKHSSTAEL